MTTAEQAVKDIANMLDATGLFAAPVETVFRPWRDVPNQELRSQNIMRGRKQKSELNSEAIDAEFHDVELEINSPTQKQPQA